MAVAVVAGAIGVLALLGGLVTLLDGGKKPVAKPLASVSSSPSSTATFVSGIPKPDAQQTEDLLYGLRQVDSELDRARSIDRARNTCSDLLNNKDRAQIVENTRLRFDGVAEIDTADARAIVKLIEDGGWCKAA